MQQQQITDEIEDETHFYVPLLQSDCRALEAAKKNLTELRDMLAAAQEDGGNVQKIKGQIEAAKHRVLKLRLSALDSRRETLCQHMKLIDGDRARIETNLRNLEKNLC